MIYKKFLDDHGNEAGVKLIDGDTVTFITPRNEKEWAEYQQWLADGGVPEPADVPPEPSPVYVYPKSITDQIPDAVLFAGLQAMTPRQRYDWDRLVKVRRDDPVVIEFLSQLGLDAATIMANAEVCP